MDGYCNYKDAFNNDNKELDKLSEKLCVEYVLMEELQKISIKENVINFFFELAKAELKLRGKDDKAYLTKVNEEISRRGCLPKSKKWYKRKWVRFINRKTKNPMLMKRKDILMVFYND